MVHLELPAIQYLNVNQVLRKNLKGLDDSHWFIEDFIDGREFNMSVLAGKDGPEVLPPAEIVFVNYDDTQTKNS